MSDQQPILFTTCDRGIVRLLPLGGDLFMLQEVEMHLPSHPRQHKTPDCRQPHDCEVCGAKATAAVVDELDVTPSAVRFQELRPLPPVHYYCAQHAREAVQVKTSELLNSLKG